MTQKSSLTDITNANSFGDWRQRTNELIDIAQKSVTFGPGEAATNVGDVTIVGDFALATGNVSSFDIVDTVTASSLKIKKDTDVEGVLFVNQTVGGASGESRIQMTQGTDKTNTWEIKTSSNHANLRITKGDVSLQMAGDGNITSVGDTDIVIPTSMIDGGVFNSVSIGTVTPSTGAFTKLDCSGAGGAGAINNVSIGSTNPSTGSFTTFNTTGGSGSSIINTTIGQGDASNRAAGSFTTFIATGGGSSAINNVPIGASVESTGKFSTLESTGAATFNSATVTGNLTATASQAAALTSEAMTAVLNQVYPIGSLYCTTSASSPNALGIPGNWERYAQGQALTGWKSGDSDFGTVGGTGGHKTHTLTVSQIPAHTHDQNNRVERAEMLISQSLKKTVSSGRKSDIDKNSGTISTKTFSTGGGGSHPILQPYRVVYIWRRINP